MNTTITKDQMLLKDNEVYFIGNDLIPEWYFDDTMQLRQNVMDDEDYWKRRPDYKRISHTTAKLDGVQHLQREWFVKGEQDKLNDALCEWMNDEKDHYEAEAKALEFGYNAKKGEFTREEMEKAYYELRNKAELQREELSFDDFINSLHPLQLPEKIVLSPDGELVEIQW